MYKRLLAVLFIPLVAGGCGGATAADPAPPVHGVQLAIGPYPIAAGSEKYLCYAKTLSEPADVAVTRFDPYQGASTHHLAVFKTIAPEPEGLTECPVLIKQTWIPLYADGRSASSLVLPSGAGFPLKKNDQILVQLHLLNANTVDHTEKTFINLSYADDATSITPAGIWAIGSQRIDMPIGATGYSVQESCTLDHQLNIFGVFPHMHQQGTSLVLERGTGPADAKTIYQRNPWVFGDQPLEQIPMTLNKGDFLQATCTYDNRSGHEVKFGESSNDEMCYLVLFYTPFTGLDGCIDFGP